VWSVGLHVSVFDEMDGVGSAWHGGGSLDPVFALVQTIFQ
jgi:hypothetical protein